MSKPERSKEEGGTGAAIPPGPMMTVSATIDEACAGKRTAPDRARSGAGPRWQWHRDMLRRNLAKHPIDDVSLEEVEAHFEGMPPHYWERVDESELAWGIQNTHKFLHGLAASESGDTPAIVTWRQFPRLGCTKVMVSTWDRAGLLTKIAGYVSALRLNIVRAEAFTRADNIVLDVFWLCAPEHGPVNDPERLRQLAFLIEGGLSEPPRFVSTWACASHKFISHTPSCPTTVTFNNADSAEHTIITIEAAERLGLLHDIVHALAEQKLNIVEALIETVGDVARDVFYVTDEQHRKVTDKARLAAIERMITKALDAQDEGAES